MLESVNEIAILVSTLLALAVGSIWYSPLLFEKHWLQAIGMSPEDMEASKSKMPLRFGFAALANFVLLFVVAQFIEISRAIEQSAVCLATLLLALLAAAMGSFVIWEQRPLSYLLINLGYFAIVIFGGVGVIGHWPW